MRRFILTTSFSCMLVGAFWLCALLIGSVSYLPNNSETYLKNKEIITPDLVPLGISVATNKLDSEMETIEEDLIPESIGETKDKFSDISEHWAKEYIGEVVNRGIMSGITEDTFSPNSEISKAMFITALGKIRNNVPTTNSKYIDVAADSYYSKYIAWAYEKGLLLNAKGDKFYPSKNITREEIAFTVAKYLEKCEGMLLIDGYGYDDEKEFSTSTKESIYFLRGLGIMLANKGNDFNPRGTMTRGECAALICRIINNIE